MSKSVIIIGGGIAGLAAGSYARMNGYRGVINPPSLSASPEAFLGKRVE